MSRNRMVTAAAALALSAAVSPASAGSAQRAWVSGHGTDTAGCGAPTAPCRSFQYTHDNIVAAGGEIDVLDPAGYGAITITKAISIINDGVGTAGVQGLSGDAIAIHAGPSDTVVLRGLDIEGVGANYGVHLTAGGPLTVQDSTINGFVSEGILYEPNTTGSLFISHTRIANDGLDGVEVLPLISTGSATIRAMLTRVEIVGVQTGVNRGGVLSGQGVKINATVS